jgi:4-hydroxybenzoate polyprenyltransferase
MQGETEYLKNVTWLCVLIKFFSEHYAINRMSLGTTQSLHRDLLLPFVAAIFWSCSLTIIYDYIPE